MKAQIIIWSRIGHTPKTHRGSDYCDELLNVQLNVATREEAVAEGKRLMRETPHADRGHVAIPEYPNQNFRSIWL